MNEVNIQPFQVIGIWVRTSNENNLAEKDIPNLWSRFANENILNTIPNKIDNTIYSIYTDYEQDHTKPYTTLLGCKVSSLDIIPDGMIGKSFEGGTYMKFLAKGNLMEGLVIKKWLEIWEMNLNRVFTTDLEVYGEKALKPSEAEIDILIAVKQI